MTINFESYVRALEQMVNHAFTLPEVDIISIRDVLLARGEGLAEKIRAAAEACWHDGCSDVDLCVTVRWADGQAASRREYLSRVDRYGFGRDMCLGRLFVPEHDMWRLVTRQGMRYDLGFEFVQDETAPRLNLMDKAPEKENLLWPLEKEEKFWFVQVQALGKLYRRDGLIADHLAHMGLNETLVQQMVRRDVEKGTNHHRWGDGEAGAYEAFLGCCPICLGQERLDAIGNKLYAAARAYDQLLLFFYPEREEKTPLFMALWACYEQNRLTGKEKKTMYCEHCQQLFDGRVCPDCHEKGREPRDTDACFLVEKGHPWSDMLCDVLKQEGIPTLRQGSLGAGLMMTVGQYLDLESIYVPYHQLEKARDITRGLFDPVDELAGDEEGME